MRIQAPDPRPRESGDYETYFTIGYGDPRGDIILDEDGTLRLDDVRPDDCDRLIRAAGEIKEQVLTRRAEMAAPHGSRYLHKGTCQLCGKPEDDSLHADPVVVTEARFSITPEAAALAESIATGPHDDEPLPDCAGCGCAEAGHAREASQPIATGRCRHQADCGCAAYALPQDAPETAAAR